MPRRKKTAAGRENRRSPEKPSGGETRSLAPSSTDGSLLEDAGPLRPSIQAAPCLPDTSPIYLRRWLHAHAHTHTHTHICTHTCVTLTHMWAHTHKHQRRTTSESPMLRRMWFLRCRDSVRGLSPRPLLRRAVPAPGLAAAPPGVQEPGTRPLPRARRGVPPRRGRGRRARLLRAAPHGHPRPGVLCHCGHQVRSGGLRRGAPRGLP